MNLMNVGTRKINATWTREMAEDLNNFGKCFIYKVETQKEKEIIETYFDVDIIDGDSIYYNIFTRQERRKIKLLILKKDDVSEIVKKILENSTIASTQDFMERKLSIELAKEIDREINGQFYDKTGEFNDVEL